MIHLLTFYGTLVCIDAASGTLVHDDLSDAASAAGALDIEPLLGSLDVVGLKAGSASTLRLASGCPAMLEGACLTSRQGERLVGFTRAEGSLHPRETPAVLEWVPPPAASDADFFLLFDGDLAKLLALRLTLWRRDGARRLQRLVLASDFRARLGPADAPIQDLLASDSTTHIRLREDAGAVDVAAAGLLEDEPHIPLHRSVRRQAQLAESPAAFLQTPDTVLDLSGEATATLRPPLMLPGGLACFVAHYHDGQGPPFGLERPDLKLRRESRRFVALDRYGEGVVLSAEGASNEWGFLGNIRPQPAWLGPTADGLAFWPTVAEPEAEHVGRVVVCFNGNLQNHFHWLIEGMLPLGILRQHMPPGFTCLMPERLRHRMTIHHADIMRALGYDALPTTWSSASIVAADEVLFTENNSLVERTSATMLRAWADGLRRTWPVRATGRKRLFIRRGDFRGIVDHEQVDRLLDAWGFETVSLDDMPFRDQIALFDSAEFVVAVHGAGLSNLVFCREGTRVLEIMPEVETRPFFWMISEKMGLRHAMLHCPVADGPAHCVPFNRKVVVRPDRLEALYHTLRLL